MRVCTGRTVRDIWHPIAVREAHGDRNGATAEERRAAKPRSFGRGLEAAFHHDAFRVEGAEPRMHAVERVRQVDDLRRDWWLLCRGHRASHHKRYTSYGLQKVSYVEILLRSGCVKVTRLLSANCGLLMSAGPCCRSSRVAGTNCESLRSDR